MGPVNFFANSIALSVYLREQPIKGEEIMRLFILTVFFVTVPFARRVIAAAPSSQSSEEYLIPSDSITILRGPMSFCRASKPQNGVRGLSYIQFGRGKCSTPASTTRIGKDRPEDEPVSPGIPFRNRGIE